ncbi:hypothetical protein [Tissierella creatinophila]|uniref:Flagellar protein FliT n=1 Tax=Tissierella creatinophila DSM 6911 TaxID=1123403 RepID=A0A1U7M993_TISCR|nr:hypothetical protein [Tissierella creatinophila]OLS03779.1 hypothetical protein TICRE_02920 [Tissierella creatinophila DSM 6911]
MEPNIENLKLERIEILENILKKIKRWDKTYEMGIEIIDDVEVILEELKEINNLLESSLGFFPLDKPYEEKIGTVRWEYSVFLDELKIKREKLLELIKETRLKEKIKNNYILNDRGSIFIDKDL